MYDIFSEIIDGSMRFGIQGGTMRIRDVTTQEQALRELVARLNKFEAAEVHLMDIVENWLAG